MKIAIIGGGNMGEAFARGLQQHFENGDFELMVSERNREKHAAFHSLEIVATSDNAAVVRDADVVILAVKPADMEATCREIAAQLAAGVLILSIAAGVKIASMEAWLATARVVRVMPNLLSSIGHSVSVWYSDISDLPTKKLIHTLLKSIGTAHELEREDEIDMATAISGCGPAYVWYFMEKMIAAGEKIGLDSQLAKKLTLETFSGAGLFAAHGDFDPHEMRLKVASKGGSTERAIAVFDEREIDSVMNDAVQAAYKRAVELGQ